MNRKIIPFLNVFKGKILNDCFKVNDFDQETYENKIYGDYKIKSKKQPSPLIAPVNVQSTTEATSHQELSNLSLIQNPPQSQPNLNTHKNENSIVNGQIQTNNLTIIATDVKQSIKYELSSENTLSNLTGIKRPASNEIMINAGGNYKKSKENHYFSKKHLIFDPFSIDFEELFGLNHSLFQNNNDFIRAYVKNKDNNISFLEMLTLQKPFKVSSHFYLINLGTFYFTKQPIQFQKGDKGEITLKSNEAESLKFGNGFCTYRMYKSFLSPGILVYYYQYKVYIKEIDLTFYVILPEDGIGDFHNNELFLFHTNLNDLMTLLFQKIQEKQKDELEFRPFRFLENKKCLFPTILNDIIYEKILKKYTSNHNEFNVDANLNDTFKKFTNSLGVNNMICDSLEPLINQFFESQLNKFDLPKMHLGDFFFGYNHPKIQALVKLVKKNRTFSLNRLPEELKPIFCSLSPMLKLKQKLAFTDLQDMKIPLPYKCFRL